MNYKIIVDPKEGELVQYVGVHALSWRPHWGDPTVAFIKDDESTNQIALLVEALEDILDRTRSRLPINVLGPDGHLDLKLDEIAKTAKAALETAKEIENG